MAEVRFYCEIALAPRLVASDPMGRFMVVSGDEWLLDRLRLCQETRGTNDSSGCLNPSGVRCLLPTVIPLWCPCRVVNAVRLCWGGCPGRRCCRSGRWVR